MLENKAQGPYFRQCKLSTMLTQLDHMIIPQSAAKNHSRVPISGEQKIEIVLQGMKPPQSYSLRSIVYPRVHTKITQSYSFRSIYPRVRTKITPNNFKSIIHNPAQRTSKSAPRFLPEKQRQERASTPMHRLPQCHRGNPRVECQNAYQVNQYDTPLSPQVFICKT